MADLKPCQVAFNKWFADKYEQTNSPDLWMGRVMLHEVWEAAWNTRNVSAPVQGVPDDASTVKYIQHYGSRCRDCADENGICPSSGLPCEGDERGIRHVLSALNYGLKHGYIAAPTPTSLDLDKCPSCGGPADNGHDREIPPSPYNCTKCSATPAGLDDGGDNHG